VTWRQAGFGPVAVDEKDEPFHADWEARMWGIARSVRSVGGWNIDWWRHSRELIEPVDYLTRPYFDQWMQTYAALLVDSGIATVAEIANGKSTSPGPAVTPLTVDGVGKAASHAALRPTRVRSRASGRRARAA
jgi:nitrile hydratase